jgi:LmbE family N-acetylglucosaminyl deacetylase
VLDLPDGRLPAHWDRAKDALEALRPDCDTDLVLAPSVHDAHQDHRGLAKLVPTVFRDHLVAGYEILKWDGDLAQPQAFFPLSDEVAARKAALLDEHYPSQRGRDWFDAETFLGLARIRGVQCHARYAEAFHLPKLVLSAGCPTDS